MKKIMIMMEVRITIMILIVKFINRVMEIIISNDNIDKIDNNDVNNPQQSNFICFLSVCVSPHSNLIISA